MWQHRSAVRNGAEKNAGPQLWYVTVQRGTRDARMHNYRINVLKIKRRCKRITTTITKIRC